MGVTKGQLFLALAAEILKDGKVVANPYKKWSEIDTSLPDIAIQVFGPPPTSGTRDAWVELVMEEGSGELPVYKDLSHDVKQGVCRPEEGRGWKECGCKGSSRWLPYLLKRENQKQ